VRVKTRAWSALATSALFSLSVAGCSMEGPADEAGIGVVPAETEPSTSPTPTPTPSEQPAAPPDAPARGTVTLGFAGDVHFEYHLVGYLDGRPRPFGPITEVLKAPDLMMVNLETALTTRGAPEPKQYNFRAPPRALDALRDAGVDVVSLANNHAADYGGVGVRDTLAAVRSRGLPAVGFGKDLEAALTPFTTEIRGTDIAVFGISNRQEETAKNWSADADSPGIVSTRHIPELVEAVRDAKRTADVVVVYAHWGRELSTCPNPRQFTLLRALRSAGVDVLVGSHAHVLQGAGWRGDTYVDFGLGNFIWYHDHQPASGVLNVTIRDGKVVGDDFLPAEIQATGQTIPLRGPDRAAALAGWKALRSCTGLAAERPAG
jgi:hypothetical protein